MVPDRREGGVWYLYPLLTQLSPQGILSPDTPVPFFLSRCYRFAFLEIFWLKNIHGYGDKDQEPRIFRTGFFT